MGTLPHGASDTGRQNTEANLPLLTHTHTHKKSYNSNKKNRQTAVDKTKEFLVMEKYTLSKRGDNRREEDYSLHEKQHRPMKGSSQTRFGIWFKYHKKSSIIDL